MGEEENVDDNDEKYNQPTNQRMGEEEYVHDMFIKECTYIWHLSRVIRWEQMSGGGGRSGLLNMLSGLDAKDHELVATALCLLSQEEAWS